MNLDQATIKQLTWKPSTVRSIAVRIVRAAHSNATIYPEDVDVSDIPPGDANCVGIAFRMLSGAGVIKRSGRYRKSNRVASNGRTVFEYQIEHQERANTFLVRNGSAALPTAQRQFDL